MLTWIILGVIVLALVYGIAVYNRLVRLRALVREAFSGITTGSHAWNRVLVDGAWDVVDVTWDDVDTAHARHDYFLVASGDPKLDTRDADSEWIVDSEVAKYGG